MASIVLSRFCSGWGREVRSNSACWQFRPETAGLPSPIEMLNRASVKVIAQIGRVKHSNMPAEVLISVLQHFSQNMLVRSISELRLSERPHLTFSQPSLVA